MNYNVLEIIVSIAVLLFSVAVHESAHGWMAERFGDPTARNQGRITLNPVSHLDPIGSIIFPFILAISGAPVFGWAKPVLVNPYNLRDRRRAQIYISAAGPGSNLILGGIGIVLFLLLKGMGVVGVAFLFAGSGINPNLLELALFTMIIVNIYLAIFNLLPVPPLDGSGILEGTLKGEALYNYQKIKPYGFIILIMIIFTPILGVIANPILRIVLRILAWG